MSVRTVFESFGTITAEIGFDKFSVVLRQALPDEDEDSLVFIPFELVEQIAEAMRAVRDEARE